MAYLPRPKDDEKDGLVMVQIRRKCFSVVENQTLTDIGNALGARVVYRDVGDVPGHPAPMGVLFLSGIRIGIINAKEIFRAVKNNRHPFRKK